MGVDPQRHVHRAVSGQVLNLLDIQSRLEQPGNIGVPKNVRRNVGVRQFPLDQLPHASIRGFRQRLVVFHGNHILGMGSLLPRRQPELQFLRERNVPLPCFRLHILADRRLIPTDHGVMPDMDDLSLKVDVLPLESHDFPAPHPRVKGRQQESLCPSVFDPLQKQIALLRRQGLLLRGFPSSGLQHIAYRGLCHQAVFLGGVEDAPQIDQNLGLHGIALVGKAGHDGLNLHGCDIPEPVVTNRGKNVLVQRVANGNQAVFPEVGFLIKIIPHLSKVAEGFLAANVHAGLDQNLSF